MTGLELKAWLLVHGVKIQDLADSVGISQSAMSQRLSVKSIKTDFLEKIEDILGKKIEIEPFDEGGESMVTGFLELLQKKDEQMDRLISLLEAREGGEHQKKKDVG